MTYTISATLIASIGYVVLHAFECHSAEIDVPSDVQVVFIIIFVLAFGVIWEMFEFTSVGLVRVIDVRPPVTVYGIDDIVTDMTFNTVGAVIVAIWGDGLC